MKQAIYILSIGALLSACGGNSFDNNTDADQIEASDTTTGYQTGQGTESNSVADPNAANTINTPVPLDTVEVDTTSNK